MTSRDTDGAPGVPTVLLAGDSTVALHLAEVAPVTGWGAHLGSVLTARVACALADYGRGPVAVPVLNFAKNGASTDSHRADHLWDTLLTHTTPGDVVVLQFGHNDPKYDELRPARQRFRQNLVRFVAEARHVEAVVVLCTPPARRHWVDGRLDDSHGEYPGVTRSVAKELGTPLVDLTAGTTRLYEQLGEQGSRDLVTHLEAGASPLYPDGIADDTHFSYAGGLAVADLVAEALAPVVIDRVLAGATSTNAGVPCGSPVA
jgi:lysophospholipase L1-like esterase